MSKSKYNVQTPDNLVEAFGADTLRLYEMFLGPLEQFKPWDVKGINGVHNFLRKFWRLVHDSKNKFNTNVSRRYDMSRQQNARAPSPSVRKGPPPVSWAAAVRSKPQRSSTKSSSGGRRRKKQRKSKNHHEQISKSTV